MGPKGVDGAREVIYALRSLPRGYLKAILRHTKVYNRYRTIAVVKVTETTLAVLVFNPREYMTLRREDVIVLRDRKPDHHGPVVPVAIDSHYFAERENMRLIAMTDIDDENRKAYTIVCDGSDKDRCVRKGRRREPLALLDELERFHGDEDDDVILLGPKELTEIVMRLIE